MKNKVWEFYAFLAVGLLLCAASVALQAWIMIIVAMVSIFHMPSATYATAIKSRNRLTSWLGETLYRYRIIGGLAVLVLCLFAINVGYLDLTH